MKDNNSRPSDLLQTRGNKNITLMEQNRHRNNNSVAATIFSLYFIYSFVRIKL